MLVVVVVVVVRMAGVELRVMAAAEVMMYVAVAMAVTAGPHSGTLPLPAVALIIASAAIIFICLVAGNIIAAMAAGGHNSCWSRVQGLCSVHLTADVVSYGCALLVSQRPSIVFGVTSTWQVNRQRVPGPFL